MTSRNLIWTGAYNDDYTNRLNWDDTTNSLNPAASPPTSSDFVSFSSTAGGTVNFDGGSAETFNVNGTGAWMFSGALTLSGQTNPSNQPFAFNISSTATFSDVTLNAQGYGAIDAALTVESDSTVTTLGDGIGDTTGKTGSLTLTGAGTSWHIESDLADNQGNSITGYLSIGYGAETTTESGGNGTLTVTAGASLLVDIGASLAGSTGSTGTATISDDGTWTISGGLIVGQSGIGTLTIESGGTVDNASFGNLGGNTGAVGSVTVDGAGSLWKNGGQIGVGLNGAGTLIVSNGGSVVATDEIDVAENFGSTGTLTIESGGKVKSGGSYDNIGGNASNADGLVTVEGPNSSWVMTASLFVGSNGPGTLDISNDGSVQAAQLTVAQDFGTTGRISITTGGTLTTAGPYDNLATSNNSVATVTVDGTGSEWKSAAQITVGANGTATLTVSNGGSVDAADGLHVGGNSGSIGDLVVESGGKLTSEGGFSSVGGYSSGAKGTATVEDAGSSWIVGIGFVVGQNGAGTLDILNGGSVQAPQLTVGQNGGSQGNLSITTGGTLTTAGPYDTIGSNAGSFGTVTVDGTGSLWSSGGNIGIGQNGSGTLIISDSGVVNATDQVNVGEDTGGSGDLLIESGGKLTSGGAAHTADTIGGFNQNANGTVTVEGSGSSWTLGAVGLSVGNGGDGTLNIINDGSVQAGQLIVAQSAASFGTVVITSGGTLTTAGPNDSIGSNGGSVGSVSVTGTGSVWQSGGAISVGRSGGGALTVGGGGTVTADGLIDVGQNAGSVGTLTINAGGTVKDIAAQQSSNEMLVIGDAGTGTVTVTGAGAVLDTNGNPMRIGNVAGGNGSLTVSDGGSVTVGSANTNTGQNAISLGRSGGNGSLTVTGAGSTLTADGFVSDGRASNGTILVENDGSLAVNVDPVGSGGLSIGAGSSGGLNGIGGSGSATVTSGGELSSEQGITVGGNGVDGTLTVNDGGIVNVGTQLVVGVATLLSGATYGGDGSVAIGAGGTVQITGAAQDSYSAVLIGLEHTGSTGLVATGEITVSGTGALLNTNGSEISVGSSGVGSLTISQGGSVVSGTPNSSDAAALSVGSPGVGSVSLTGTGSSLTAIGFAFIGESGTGSLLVQNSATMTIGIDLTGRGGLSIGGTRPNTTWSALYVGGSGSALVTADGHVDSEQNIYVGSTGTTGTLTVNNGGTVQAGDQIDIGNTSTSVVGGTVTTISGTTTVTSATAYAGAGTINVGAGGTLEAGGSEPNGSSSIIVGYGVGGTGALNVSGAGALVDAGGQRITIGRSGDGTMLVSQGGAVEAGANYTDVEAATYLGYDATGTGALTVTDIGSSFTAAGEMEVGVAGTGSLLVENEGEVTATSLDSAVDAGSVAIITVTGSSTGSSEGGGNGGGLASQLNVNGQFTIGDTGSAELSILNGATATVGNMDIGLNTGSTGTVDLEGEGTELTVNGTLNVGDLGAAELIVGYGAFGTVTTGVINVGIGGQILFTGGTLDPPGILNNPNVIGGQGEYGGSVNNTGTIYAQAGLHGSTFEVTGSIVSTSTGELLINKGGNLKLDGAVSGQSVVFNAPAANGTLTIGDLPEFDVSSISGFLPGDKIVLPNVPYVNPVYDANTGVVTLEDAHGNAIATLTFEGSYTQSDFSDAFVAPCFLFGTRIATERGPIAVQELRIGDRVLTADGGSRPVRWIGMRRVDTSRHPKPRDVLPVRVAPHAFGPGAPHNALFLSPDHAVFIEDVLIPVQYLIDGAAIRQLSDFAEIIYYHVELDRHDVVLAEGLPVESYLDTGNRAAFQDGDARMALPPDVAMRVWESQGCAPLVITGPALQAARRRLAMAEAVAA